MGRGWLVGPAELGGPRCRGARGAVGAEELQRGEEGEADEVGSLGQGRNGRARARWQVGSGTQGGRRGLRRVAGRGAVLAGERGREAAVAGLVERDAGVWAELKFGPISWVELGFGFGLGSSFSFYFYLYFYSSPF